MRRIQSKKHKIGTNEVNKISLDDSVQTLAYFQKDLKNGFT